MSACLFYLVVSLPTQTAPTGCSSSKSIVSRLSVVSGLRCSGFIEVMVQITMASIGADGAKRGFLDRRCCTTSP